MKLCFAGYQKMCRNKDEIGSLATKLDAEHDFGLSPIIIALKIIALHGRSLHMKKVRASNQTALYCPHQCQKSCGVLFYDTHFSLLVLLYSLWFIIALAKDFWGFTFLVLFCNEEPSLNWIPVVLSVSFLMKSGAWAPYPKKKVLSTIWNGHSV
jgi:hypothetical protein